MKNFKCILMFVTVLMLSASSAFSINWQTNYDNALQQAKDQNKDIVLLFTGSDWCVWCKKLEKEALDTSEFDHAVGDKFIFVKLDFPMKHALDSQQKEQNKRLKEQFGVRGFPSVIILDKNGKKVGTTGYKPGGGKSFADLLINMSNNH